MNERLWSPQMRKWVKDARVHGLEIGWEKIPRRQVWEAGQLRMSTIPVKSNVPPLTYGMITRHTTIAYYGRFLP